MAFILTSSGFNNLESLQEFSKRFPKLNCLDRDFDKIWVCHKDQNDIPEFKVLELEDKESYNSLCKQVEKKLTLEENFTFFLTEFSTLSIFDKIYTHFNHHLTEYLFTKCYLFYEWGVNAFEPIINRFEIHKKIEDYQRLKPKILKRKISNVIFNNQISDETSKKRKREENFEEATDKSKLVVSKGVSFKKLKTAIDKTKKFFDHSKNSKNPYQETFSLRRILYDLKQRPQWSRYHIMSKGSVDELMSFIVQVKVVSNVDVQNRLLAEEKNWVLLKELLGIFLERHKAVDKNNGYGRILKKHLKKVFRHTNRRLIPIPKGLICSYVIDVLRRVVPLGLFGINRLRKSFFSSIIKLINSTKEENFIWYSFLYRLVKNKAHLPWCTQISDKSDQTLMILQVFRFLVIEFVLNLLKNNFYITETGSSGLSLSFYRKCDVESASVSFVNSLLYYRHIRTYKRRDHDVFTLERKWLESGVIEEKDLEKKLKTLMSDATQYKQPIASVRFLPKKESSDELRIITSFKKKIRQTSGLKKLERVFSARLESRKKKLFLLKLLLNFLIDEIGFGIKPQPSNAKLEAAWYKAIRLKEKFGKLYFVKADIADAFDSIIHDLLISVLEKNLEKKTIQLKKIVEWKKENGKIQKTVRLSFSNRPRENSIMISRSVLRRTGENNDQYKPEFLEILKQVVTEQRLDIKGKVYKLIKGLAQGSAGKFSPQLCEIYYSSMDRLYFRNIINSDDSVLLRGVDDYLLITVDEHKAKLFLEITQNGIGSYGVRFNKAKLQSNLTEDNYEISYLGLIFNFADMTVKPNYSKYRGRDLLTSMKLRDQRGNDHFNKTLFMEKKLRNIISLKLQPILLDKNYNSITVVRQTVFQAVLFQSLRVLTLANHLFQGEAKNDIGVYKILMKSYNKITNLVKPCCLSKNELKWLFLFGAFKIISKYSGQYKTLLLIIRFLLRKSEKSFVKSESALLLQLLKKDVFDEVFWEKLKDIFGKLGKPKT